MILNLPDFAVVVLIGASGSGKSTFARRDFLPTEILSSDHFRALVSDEETNQDATRDAFDMLHHLLEIRLRRRRLTVIDATNVQAAARKSLIDIAHSYHAVPVAVVLDVPTRVCLERNQGRENRDFGRHVVDRHVRDLHQSLKTLRREGFRYVWHLEDEATIDGATFQREPLWTDKRTTTGLFDIIGDIHGCYDELTDLLTRLGYAPDEQNIWRHSAGRRLIFLGDLVDRGAKVVEVCRLVMDTVAGGAAFCVPGNHDIKLMRALQGRDVQKTHGLDKSLEQIALLPADEKEGFQKRYLSFVDSLVSHYWLDNGNLAVAHAGITEAMLGRASAKVRDFALYGETTGETDEYGLPVRHNWAAEYRGKTTIVYGHTPIPAPPQWLNNTINIDTGCVFGGALTALRYPEREIVSVPAHHVYAEPIRPLVPVSKTAEDAPAISLQWQHDDLLDIADYIGKRVVETRLAGNVLVNEGNAFAALEVMSRFALHPRWLLYLPPTMSPVATAPDGLLLERPQEAWEYFRQRGVETVICQEKHMGSRAVLVVCRNETAAYARFGAENEVGAVLTRTGRSFFESAEVTRQLLTQTAAAIAEAGLWDEWQTDWCALDAEILPWNAKAQGLLRSQYAPVARVGLSTLAAEEAVARQASQRGIEGMEMLADQIAGRVSDLAAYREAYARYCWDTDGITGVQIAPFHLLAVEGRTMLHENHDWHIRTLSRLASVSALFRVTETVRVDVADPLQCDSATDWWQTRTDAGAEGMVVKPLDFVPERGCQPAVKVRGREYLRIIYGPEYTQPANLARLRQRGLGAKRNLAAKEFALGVESLERFVKREPLRRVHECVFAVLALESEPVDPRL